MQDNVSPNPPAAKQAEIVRFHARAAPFGCKKSGIRPVPIFPSRSAALSEESRAIWFPLCF